MQSPSYQDRRQKLTRYFDSTAAGAWSRLTSDAPVGRVRATVRAGRDLMRARLLSWLPIDMRGRRLLDAGCGTGALAIEAARHGASVVAVDVSATLVQLADGRTPAGLPGDIQYCVGDMLDPAHGEIDFVVAMDSMIHYDSEDIVRMLSILAGRTRCSILFTVAPRTPALAVMHAVGRLIPYHEHRAPAIVPVSDQGLRRRISEAPALRDWSLTDCDKISSGFYKSQAYRLKRR